MARSDHWLLAISVPEWLNWVATASLRVSLHRVVGLSSASDQGNFDALMALSPQITWSEDQAYILARLRADCFSMAGSLPSSTRLDPVMLDLRSVEAFVPVSDRAARLLEADARRAAVDLAAPIYEPLWSAWVNCGLEEKRDANGRAFATALGLTAPLLDELLRVAGPYLSNPAALNPRVIELRGTRAFGWGVAISLLREKIPEESWTQIRTVLGTKQLIEELQGSFVVQKALHNDSSAVSAMRQLSIALAELKGPSSSPLSVALVFHYADLLRDGGSKFNMSSLITDLVELLLAEGEAVAGTVAYLIGRSAPDTMVTTLIYARSPDQYPCLLSRKPPCETDVSELARTEERRRIAATAVTPEEATPAKDPTVAIKGEPLAPEADSTLSDRSGIHGTITGMTAGNAEHKPTNQGAGENTPPELVIEAAPELGGGQVAAPVQATDSTELVAIPNDQSVLSQTALAFEDQTPLSEKNSTSATPRRKTPKAKKSSSATSSDVNI